MVDEGPEERAPLVVAIVLFAAIAIAMGADLAADFGEGASAPHVSLEGAVMALAVIGAAVFAQRLRRQAQALRKETAVLRGRTAALEADLARTNEQADRWRDQNKQLVEGLAASIDAELERWGLSIAEKEVGLLLLKGLSHKQIAEVRGVSERTVRQQARAVYRKSGLTGRADLAAYFLEDLLVPPPPKNAPADVTPQEPTATNIASAARGR